jgi:hypothetical protein
MYAINHVAWTNEWKSVIFSDEKTFNLDGPDGPTFHWKLPGVDVPPILTPPTNQRGSVKVWGAFCYKGVSKLIRYSEALESRSYVAFFTEELLRSFRALGGRDFTFQQDNASYHASAETMAFFTRRGIDVMGWPARSPDLNPIENLWGIITSRVYFREGRRVFFNSIKSLWEAIEREWKALTLETLQNLVNSMQRRMECVICSDGDWIEY